MQSKDHMPDFHNITDEVKKIVEQSGVKNGICVGLFAPYHMLVMTQECSHDDIFRQRTLTAGPYKHNGKIVPTCRHEGQYLHPGPKHIEFALTWRRRAQRSLNTDAHLRSCFFGRSEK